MWVDCRKSERRDVAREQLTSLAWQAGAHGMCARDQTSTTTTLTAERALTAERTDCEQHMACGKPEPPGRACSSHSARVAGAPLKVPACKQTSMVSRTDCI